MKTYLKLSIAGLLALSAGCASPCTGANPTSPSPTGLSEFTPSEYVQAVAACEQLSHEWDLVLDETPATDGGARCVAHPEEGPCPVETNPFYFNGALYCEWEETSW